MHNSSAGAVAGYVDAEGIFHAAAPGTAAFSEPLKQFTFSPEAREAAIKKREEEAKHTLQGGFGGGDVKGVRAKANSLHSEISDHLEKNGVQNKWLMDSGGAKLKKSGDVHLSYSVRSNMDDVHKAKDLIAKHLASKGITPTKIGVSNSFGTSRPEGKVTAVIPGHHFQ